MPFPLAHPAAVLPLVRRPFVASALVAGAVAPDLLYVGPLYQIATQYIHGNLTLTLTHKVTSALWLDPLLALLLLLVFHFALRRPLVALAPRGLAARLPEPSRAPVLWTVVSVVAGAFTHVIWDAFTHWDGYFVRRFPGFFGAEVTAGWEVSRVLQYVSTLGGCLVLAVWLHRWYRRTSPSAVTSGVPAWVRYFVLGLAVAFAAVSVAVELGRVDGAFAGETAVRLVLSGLVSGALIVLVGYVLVWHLIRWRRRWWVRRDATDGAA
ncbi:DUF4184 family protein [Kribbella sp. NPDC048915]|uniref:DUF4184 family protein n=1 Tax=Kribbella sp. NPDC048915 TaxID=3155148 RepID=UPI0033D0ADEA